MRTPDEIKTALGSCVEEDCRACAYYKAKATCQQDMVADAIAYIQRLEAELAATRVQLAKDGDLCRICKAQRAQDCVWDCINCDNAECGCKRCIDTDSIEGFEWAGGAT